jgi:hypothetical protein
MLYGKLPATVNSPSNGGSISKKLPEIILSCNAGNVFLR